LLEQNEASDRTGRVNNFFAQRIDLQGSHRRKDAENTTCIENCNTKQKIQFSPISVYW